MPLRAERSNLALGIAFPRNAGFHSSQLQVGACRCDNVTRNLSLRVRNHKTVIASGAKQSLFSRKMVGHPGLLSRGTLDNDKPTPLLTEEFTLIRRGWRVVRFTGCDSPCGYLSFYTVQAITWEDSPQAVEQVFCRKFRHCSPGFYRSASHVR